MGAEYIDEGGRELPSPEKLFVLVPHESEGGESSRSETSSVSIHSSEKDAESVVVLKNKDKAEHFQLEKELCGCNQCIIEQKCY